MNWREPWSSEDQRRMAAGVRGTARGANGEGEEDYEGGVQWVVEGFFFFFFNVIFYLFDIDWLFLLIIKDI